MEGGTEEGGLFLRATGSEVTPSTGDRVPPIFVSGRFARLQELVPGYTTTISDNLGESARDMLIFPIPSDMRAQERERRDAALAVCVAARLSNCVRAAFHALFSFHL